VAVQIDDTCLFGGDEEQRARLGLGGVAVVFIFLADAIACVGGDCNCSSSESDLLTTVQQ
jgi:hypothetical protein